MDTQRLRQSILSSIERLLLGIGAVALAYFVYVSVESMLYQAFENRELDAILMEPAAPPAETARSTPRPRIVPAKRSVLGRMEIPRLDVRAVVRAGSDARTLRLAVGHIPGTALPGEAGNIGLAGHRDTFFRRLRNIRSDDEIRMVTTEGTYVYRVARTHIVQPNDVWVLNATSRPALTLVTCYPFSYIGSAPQRFIVRAELIRVVTNSSVSS